MAPLPMVKGCHRCRSCEVVGKAIPIIFNPYPPLPGHMATATPEGRTDGVTRNFRVALRLLGARTPVSCALPVKFVIVRLPPPPIWAPNRQNLPFIPHEFTVHTLSRE